ncbi:hypothetical protein FIU87_10450 [Bacillus sp. THAF10]|uniref:DUF6509 family protein n=1 Tax=Bacillus sp. THAF10 TaxID=2587848 RepID=UPI001268F91A|nr:DUF6509 family protein [Bacillus sp. THAF10]QFT89066.1 hypothetical protein FIU87_10450 [Bacillus sp. THAF10]
MIIKGHEAEKLKDPTGILEGERYEFFLELEIPEDDELYTENGVYLRLILAVAGENVKIASYQFYEDVTNKPLDFELEEEEEEQIRSYCNQHLHEVI